MPTYIRPEFRDLIYSSTSTAGWITMEDAATNTTSIQWTTLDTTATGDCWTSWTSHSPTITIEFHVDQPVRINDEEADAEDVGRLLNGEMVEQLGRQITEGVRATFESRILYGGAREADRETDEQRRLREERTAALELANWKAERLLEEILTDEQLAMLRNHGHFFVDSPTGRRYRIQRGISGNVKEVIDGIARYSYCAHPREDVPVGDVLAAQKLMLETEQGEQEFLRVANRTEINYPRTNIHAGREAVAV